MRVPGSAYWYTAESVQSEYSEQSKLVASDGGNGDAFGWDLAVYNNVIAVAAYLEDEKGNNAGKPLS